MPFKDKNKQKEYSAKYREENRDKISSLKKNWAENNLDKVRLSQRKYAAKPHNRYATAIRSAKNRGLSWDIVENDYYTIIQLPCYYCDNQMGNTQAVTVGSGLDRLDNSKGYELNNVVSCCGLCNYIRGEELTSEEAKIAITAVIDFRKKNNDRV